MVRSRTTVNPFYVQEIAEALKGVDITVLVKNPLHPELSLYALGLKQGRNKSISGYSQRFFTLEQSAFRNELKSKIYQIKRNAQIIYHLRSQSRHLAIQQ